VQWLVHQMRRLACLGLVISAFSAACMVGDPGTGIPGSGPDAGGLPDDGGDPGPDGAPVECEPAAAVVPNGNHNPGLACLTCHDGTPGRPQWTLAGTLYTDRNGAAPITAATILVTDAQGVEHRLVTASNGNFYTSEAIAFPVRVSASKCPDTQAMTSQVAVGDCNGCHTANASQGRIHLP